MNTDYVQDLRYKLQKRVRRLNSVEYDDFHESLRQFFAYLDGHEVFKGILDHLAASFPLVPQEVEEMFDRRTAPYGFEEREHAAISLVTLRRWCRAPDKHAWMTESMFVVMKAEHNVRLDRIRRAYLHPLYDYLDEQLDESRAILGYLVRYKHRCEWFRRAHLIELIEDDSGRGEKLLSMDLYEWLHDQGLRFTIEPKSASGIPDLIAEQGTSDPLVADAKVFNPSKSKGTSYIINGFNQVYTYTRDLNEPFGYLVIFRTVPEDLKIDVSGTNMSVPFLTHNGKTIFMMVIDICEHETSASKRGQLRCWEITQDQLVTALMVPVGGEVEGKKIAEE